MGLLVREMDNPVIASSSQDELSDSLATLASGAPNGDRMPLLVYRVNVNDGSEELVRGALISQLRCASCALCWASATTTPSLPIEQSQDAETAGTALGAFGTANGGVPTDVIAPSLLFEEVEVRGPHGEPRRTAAGAASAAAIGASQIYFKTTRADGGPRHAATPQRWRVPALIV